MSKPLPLGMQEIKRRLAAYDVKFTSKERKPELWRKLMLANRADRIRDNYFDQGGGVKLTPRQERRIRKAERRAKGMFGW